MIWVKNRICISLDENRKTCNRSSLMCDLKLPFFTPHGRGSLSLSAAKICEKPPMMRRATGAEVAFTDTTVE